MKVKFLSSLSISFFLIASMLGHVQAKTMTCERYAAHGSELIGGMRNFDRDFPKTIWFNGELLKKFEKVRGKKYIRYTQIGYIRDSQADNVPLIYTLFENKKLRHSHPQTVEIRAAWNCDMSASEVLRFKEAGYSSPESQTSSLSDEKLCSTATVSHDLGDGRAKRRWNSAMKSLKKEAEKRGLDCNVGQITGQKTITNNSTSESMSLGKAKAECTSLGFSAGTEKHGDCVMKLMD